MSKIAPGRLKMINKVAERYAKELIRSGRSHGHSVFVWQSDGTIMIDRVRYRIAQVNAMRRELEARRFTKNEMENRSRNNRGRERGL